MSSSEKKSNAAKHAFFYLTSFFALGFVAFAIGNLCFQIINFYFPEGFSTWQNEFRQTAVKFAIASLIVAGPTFYFLSRIINRSVSKKDLDQDSGVRRWLTYLVMFITIATVMGDLIATIFSFLDGELTIRFFLKALTIFAIAGGIFLYYFTDMKNVNEKARLAKNKLWAIAYWAAIIIPLSWSFFTMENPKEARMRKIDTEVEQMLSTTKAQVEMYYRSEKKLPESLLNLQSPQYYLPNKKDMDEKNITYNSLGDRSYELCAEFTRDNTEDQSSQYYYGEEWKHPIGKKCFELTTPKE